MRDDLLRYYNEELEFIRHLGEEFAEDYPKIASRLKLGEGTTEDPHIERLIQAFAFLNARIRLKLEDDFPELNNSLLDIIYPHYLSPIPSCSIIQFEPHAKLTNLYKIPRNTKIVSSSAHGEKCFFLTCYPVSVWPIKVESAHFSGAPVHAPIMTLDAEPIACLRLNLKCLQKDISFSQLDLEELSFFITSHTQYRFELYDLIFNNVIGIALAHSADDPHPIFLNPSVIKPVGFLENEGLLPYPARSHLGYRLLTEYFAFPEKFLFFKIEGFTKNILANFKDDLQIFFYLNKTHSAIEGKDLHQGFALGCTPVVNLFQQSAEPVTLTHITSEIKIIPDVRHLNDLEIYSISKVTSINENNEKKEWRPFFGLNHLQNKTEKNLFWHVSKRLSRKEKKTSAKQIDYYMTLVDENFNPLLIERSFLQIDLLCSNGNLPSQLPFGGKNPILSIEGNDPSLMYVKCLMPFTSSLHPFLDSSARWRLISHLSLNYLSLTNDQEGLKALQAILNLYNFRDNPETHLVIEGIKNLNSRKIVSRALDASPYTVVQGIEITLNILEENYAGTSLLLFANVIETFLASYCNINSFTQLIIRSVEKNKVIKKWMPKAGSKTLL